MLLHSVDSHPVEEQYVSASEDATRCAIQHELQKTRIGGTHATRSGRVSCESRAEIILHGACRRALCAPQVQRTKKYAPAQEVCRDQLHHHSELRLLPVRNRGAKGPTKESVNGEVSDSAG